MDPYLESLWPEVHARLIVYASNQLNAQLPKDLQANIAENLAVYKDDHKASIRPDLHVSQDSTFPASNDNASSAVVTEPLVLRRAPHPTRHVEIVDKGESLRRLNFSARGTKSAIVRGNSIRANRSTISTPM